MRDFAGRHGLAIATDYTASSSEIGKRILAVDKNYKVVVRLAPMIVDISKVKNVVTERWSDADLRPLLLFRGGLTEGRARRLLNFTRAMMIAEVQTATEIAKLSRVENDVAHLSGLHAKSKWERMGMQSFFSRILQSPTILERVAGLEDYIWWVTGSTPHFYPYQLDRIPEFNKWSTRDWRRPAKKKREPMAEYYPFITKAPTEDHDLLLAVDALVPKSLLNEVRADVCQDMLVAILSGEATLENIKDAPKKYVSQFFRQSPSKYNHLSLDTPMYRGENAGMRTLGESII